MTDLGQPTDALASITSQVNLALSPEALANILPSRPISASPHAGWRDVRLQTYRHPPGAVICSTGVRDHVLVVHTQGQSLIDDTSHGRRQAWADEGCFSLTPAGQPVSRSWKGRPEVLLIYLRPGLVTEVAGELEIDPETVDLTPRLAVRDPVAHQFGLLLQTEAAVGDRNSSLMVEALSRAFAVHILRSYANRPMPGPAHSPALQSRRLAKVTEYMSVHLQEPIALSELATLCGLSLTHFSRAFREAMGMSPHAYLIELRLQKARDLLEHTRRPITEIAFSCGFDQSQYFATVFRRKLGFTPTAWRSARAE